MSDPIYAVLFHVRSTKLPTVLQVLEKSATLISVTPTKADEAAAPASAKKNMHYVNGKRSKGISGRELVLHCLEVSKDHICTNEELSRAFVAHEFSPNSYSSVITYLVQDGKVRRLDRGRIALVGAIIHKGASHG